MPYISYSKTYFIPPKKLTLEEYNQIKLLLKNSPNQNLDFNPESFSARFPITIKACKIFLKFGLPLMLLGAIINPNPKGFVQYIFIAPSILIPVIFIGGCNMLLEGPSFATYLKDKRKYFDDLKSAIITTQSYNDFTQKFY